MRLKRTKIVGTSLLLGSLIFSFGASAECGQTGFSPHSAALQTKSIAIPEGGYTIDYAVFFTPQAAASEGGIEAMRTRITNAFEGVNSIFANSAVQVQHRVVLIQELPLNNTSTTLPEIGSELASGFNFPAALDASQADSSLIIVDFQLPGAFANIPNSPGRARAGGSISMGRRNLVASVLAHEIGHTLGAAHDYPELSSNFDFQERFPYGNHFIGANSGKCYRTLMSALVDCRLPGFTNLPAISCDCFSNPNLLFDGTPSGEVNRADVVATFHEHAPFLASARGAFQVPQPTPQPEPTSSVPGDDDENEEDHWEMLSLTLKKNKKNGLVLATGRCVDRAAQTLEGSKIGIFKITSRDPKGKNIKSGKCSKRGTYKISFKFRKGSYVARHIKSGSDSPEAEI